MVCREYELGGFVVGVTKTEKELARKKLFKIIDFESFQEIDKNLSSYNPLKFPDYYLKLEWAKKATGENEAVISGYAIVGGIRCVVFILEPLFMMGTMGVVVGQKITNAFKIACKQRLPVISISSSGGVRIQEGVLALAQMAKVVDAVHQHSQKGLLYISVVCDPTLGGITASYASLADIIIAEEGARFGFTGKGIIEETLKETLPPDFQLPSYTLKTGQVDLIVRPDQLRDTLIRLLYLHLKT